MEEKRKTLTHRKIASRGGTNTKKRHPEHFSQAGHKSWNARAAKNPNAGNELATKGLVARRYKKAEKIAKECFLAADMYPDSLDEFSQSFYDSMISLLFSGELTEESAPGFMKYAFDEHYKQYPKEKPKKSFVNSLLGRKTAS